MNPYPIQLQIVEPASLLIEWSDGRKQQYPLAELRARCPCAGCREQRKAAAAEDAQAVPAAAPLRLVSMKPVGNYAYALTFSDGHDAGIYTFEYLRELGHEVWSDEQNAAGSQA
jgi:DUF971 family protein